MFAPFESAAVVIVLAALLGYLNHRTVRLPQSVALTVMGALASLIVIGIDRFIPGVRLAEPVAALLNGIDFHTALMNGMLSFLLFAGALHVDLHDMRRGRAAIVALATLGVLLSTTLVGGGLYFLLTLIDLRLPFAWCLVFGALISPTDPVAVMGVLQRAAVPKLLQATVAGESLFNDGIGVVIVTIVLGIAVGGGDASFLEAGKLFLIEALGGIALGLASGWLAFHAMRSIDEYNVEVMISLAVVMGGYALAGRVHVSGPVAMAVAGLFIGNRGVAEAMSDVTKDYLLKFWAVIDEVLNAVLFLLIGLEVILIPRDGRLVIVALAAIPLALLARAISASLPVFALRRIVRLGPLAPLTLIWGGLRGGISVALALGLPQGPERAIILAVTYGVVLFSVIVQGSTLEKLVRWQAARTAA